jgi:PhnB protein
VSSLLHAMLETDAGYTIMAADVPAGLEFQPMAGCSMSLFGNDPALRGYFDQLSSGGTITMPMAQQAWGDEFGMCVDRFGVPWMVDISQ